MKESGKGGVNTPSLIRSMDFCFVVNDKKLKGSGLKRGDLIFIMGNKVVPVTHKDPYLQRVLVVAALVENETVLIPKDDNEYKAYLIDPRNLEKVDKETLEWAEKNLKNQYKQE